MMRKSSILVINVVINLRYRDQQEAGLQYVSTGDDTNIKTSDESSNKKSSSASAETLELDEQSGTKEELMKGEKQEETATKKEKISEEEKKEAATNTRKERSDEYRVLEIPAVVCCPQLPDRVRLTDVVVWKIRDCLWTSPSDPPPFQTPSRLFYIKKKGDMLEDVIEKLLRETPEIGVSGQMETGGGLARHGTLSLLSIATATTVFIFDILEIGEEVFKWGLGAVLTNPHCVKITHDSRLLREAFSLDDYCF